MTDKTPTVQEVREAAAKGFSRSNGYNSVAPEEFDRWLAQVKADAIAEFIRENIKEIRKKND